MRTAALALSLALVAGCPIPQAVPEYPKGSPITPPRIVAESAVPQATLIRVPIDCGDVDPWFVDLSAVLVDEDIAEPVEARWFVDYVPDVTLPTRVAYLQRDIIGAIPQADVNRPNTARAIPAFRFYPYGTPPPVAQEGLGLTHKSPGVIHVVELVLSNGFAADPAGEPQFAMPRRTPLPGFETQVFRWTFLMADDPSLPCPADPPPP